MSEIATEIKPPVERYEVTIKGKQDNNNISYEMRIVADDPAHATEIGMEWAKHHTDNWVTCTYYVYPINIHLWES